jgi:hypothetical protein
VLYWKASEEGLAYAVLPSSIKEPQFDWDFGFQFALGYLHNQWEALLRLTHFHTHTDAMLCNRSAHPIWITSPIVPDAIKMHWRLHLALIDGLVGTHYSITPCFSIYPQLGLRYAIIRQKFNLTYWTDSQDSVRMKNKFGGIGPYGSLGGEWFLSRHWSFYAAAGLNCSYGRFYLHQDEDVGHEKVFGLRDAFMRIAVLFDAQVLLRYQKNWKKSKRKVAVQAGWDSLLLFKQNRLMRFFEEDPLDNPGDLGLMGWQWGFQWDF